MQVYIYNIYQIINSPRGEVKSLRLFLVVTAVGYHAEKLLFKQGICPKQKAGDPRVQDWDHLTNGTPSTEFSCTTKILYYR